MECADLSALLKAATSRRTPKSVAAPRALSLTPPFTKGRRVPVALRCVRCRWSRRCRSCRRGGRASCRTIADHARGAITGDKSGIGPPKKVDHWIDLVTQVLLQLTILSSERLRLRLAFRGAR